MKIGNTEINLKWLVAGLILIGIIIIIIWSIPDKPKIPDTTQSINEIKIALEKQYETQLKNKDIQINDYKSRLTVSESRYKSLVEQYVIKQKEKENVKPPITNKETRDRLIAVGFAPIPIQ